MLSEIFSTDDVEDDEEGPRSTFSALTGCRAPSLKSDSDGQGMSAPHPVPEAALSRPGLGHAFGDNAPTHQRPRTNTSGTEVFTPIVEGIQADELPVGASRDK